MTSVIIVIIVIFVIGVVSGVIATVTIGIRREERIFRETRYLHERVTYGALKVPMSAVLPEEAPDRLTSGARRLCGLHVRRPPIQAEEGSRNDVRI